MGQDRQQLIDQANEAETLVQVMIARAALKRWHAGHPDDHEMNRLLGDVTMREAWIRIKRNWTS